MYRPKRKIYFYRLYAFSSEYFSGKNTTIRKIKNKTDTAGYVKQLCKQKCKTLEDGQKIILLPDDPDKTVMEIIELTEDWLFARIGKEEDINTLLFRHNRTSRSSNIPVPPEQHAEKCTYFFVDFETCFISFLAIQGAPRCKTLSGFMNLLENGVSYRVEPVCNKDAISMLQNKKHLKSLSVTVSVPPDKLLGLDGIGLSKKDFVSLKNVSSVSIGLSIVGDRTKGIVSTETEVDVPDRHALLNLFRKISRQGKIRQAKVKAFDVGEKVTEYDLIDDLVTEQIDLPKLYDEKEYIEALKYAIQSAYNSRKEQLLAQSR